MLLSMADEAPEGVYNVRVTWVDPEELQLGFVNQFLLQLDNDGRGVFLTAGALTPPAFLGSREEREAQFKRLSFVPVQPVARLAMTRERFEELRRLMNEMAKTWPGSQEEVEDQ
jgi:hypothetical protein